MLLLNRLLYRTEFLGIETPYFEIIHAHNVSFPVSPEPTEAAQGESVYKNNSTLMTV